MENHLRRELPRLLRIATVPATPVRRWERLALAALRGEPSTPEVTTLVTSLIREMPTLMEQPTAPTRRWTPEDLGWDRPEEVTPPTEKEVPPPVEECPVCKCPCTDPITTVCAHTFCSECMDLWQRARPHEALVCPLCRTELSPAPETSMPPLELAVGPSATFSRGRPRVNEGFLSEEQLEVYLNFVVPVLRPASIDFDV